MGQTVECIFRVERYDPGMTCDRYTLRPVHAGKENSLNLQKYVKFHDAVGSVRGDTHYMLLDVPNKIIQAYGFDGKGGKERNDPNGTRTIKNRIRRILTSKGAVDIEVSLVDELYNKKDKEKIPLPHIVRTG